MYQSIDSSEDSLRHNKNSLEKSPVEKIFTNVENDENKLKRRKAVKNIIMGCIFTVLLASVTVLYSSPHPKSMSEIELLEPKLSEKGKVHKLA